MRFCPDEQHKDLYNNVSKIPKRGQNSKCQRNKTIKQVEWCFIFTVASPKLGRFCTFGSRLSAFGWETSSCHWQLDFYRKVISHNCCRGQRVRDWWTELSLNTWSRFSEPRNSFFSMMQWCHRVLCDSRSFCMGVSETAVITVLTLCDSIDSFSSLAPLLQSYNWPFLCHVLVMILPLLHQPGVTTQQADSGTHSGQQSTNTRSGSSAKTLF